jgi:hypothetical protein
VGVPPRGHRLQASDITRESRSCTLDGFYKSSCTKQRALREGLEVHLNFLRHFYNPRLEVALFQHASPACPHKFPFRAEEGQLLRSQSI